MRALPVIVLALLATPALALDCGLIADGKSMLTGAAFTRGPTDAAEVKTDIRIERGAHVTMRMQREGDASFSVGEYDRHFLVAQTITAPAKSIYWTYPTSALEGDVGSLKEGDSGRFSLAWVKDGQTQWVESVQQLIGARETRDVSGCPVEIVHLRREATRLGTDTHRVTVTEFAPALGIPLRSEIEIRSGEKTMTSLFRVETLGAP